MSAEKEIVNYWYNKKGLFTINNVKTSSNKDAGILALKFDKDRVNEVFHIEVRCSITNNISEAANLGKSISKIVDEKLVNKDDYERKDKRWLIKHLVKVSNPLRTTIFDTRLPLGSTKMAITYSDSL